MTKEDNGEPGELKLTAEQEEALKILAKAFPNGFVMTALVNSPDGTQTTTITSRHARNPNELLGLAMQSLSTIQSELGQSVCIIPASVTEKEKRHGSGLVLPPGARF